MRRNLTTALVVLAAVFFVGTTAAVADDATKVGYAGWTSDTKDVGVKMGGQIWTRYEASDQQDFNKTTGTNHMVGARVRLDADAKVNSSTSAFIQLQSVRTWGTDTGFTAGTALRGAPNSGGSGQSALSVSDQDASVGVHQAYVKVKNFFTIPVDLQLGRQEVVLDGHRLIGNVWWTMGGRAHDALRLTHVSGDNAFVYVWSKAGESGRSLTGGDVNDTFNVNAHVLWANLKNMLHANSGLSLYFIGVDTQGLDINGATAAGTAAATVAGANAAVAQAVAADNNIYLLGFRQDAKNVSQLFGIDYRAEFYYEFGKAETDASLAGGTTAGGNYYTSQGRTAGIGSDIDRRAYMFGLRAGKTFKDVTWSPNATIWYDHLSGTSDEDVRNGRFASFNTLFHTGHKYYGFMDNFVNSANMGTQYLGLRDLAGKFSVKPLDSVTVGLDMHAFWTDTNLQDNPGIRTALGIPSNTPAAGNHLGEEMDLTIAHKYNPNVNMTLGYSHFWADDTFHAISPAVGARAQTVAQGSSAANANNANWAYVMMDVLF